VENGIHLFRYNGDGPLLSQSVDSLYHARWVPAAPGVYPDRPQSPARVKRRKQAVKEGKTPAKAVKAQRYVPPSLRNKQRGSGTIAAQLEVQRTAGTRGAAAAAQTSIAVYSSARGQRVIPGLNVEPDDAPKSRSAKNRARRKKKQQEKMEQEESKKVSNEPSRVDNQEPAVVDPAKKVKKLRKKLQQIEVLAEKKERGEFLDDDQIIKLGKRQEIEQELAHWESQIEEA